MPNPNYLTEAESFVRTHLLDAKQPTQLLGTVWPFLTRTRHHLQEKTADTRMTATTHSDARMTGRSPWKIMSLSMLTSQLHPNKDTSLSNVFVLYLPQKYSRQVDL